MAMQFTMMHGNQSDSIVLFGLAGAAVVAENVVLVLVSFATQIARRRSISCVLMSGMCVLSASLCAIVLFGAKTNSNNGIVNASN